MPLYNNPFHRADIYSVSSGTDPGGGNQAIYPDTPTQAACPCVANSMSASEQERFAQMQIIVTHRCVFNAAHLNQPLQRGWKLVVNGSSLHIKGINANQAAGSIPALVEALCEELL